MAAGVGGGAAVAPAAAPAQQGGLADNVAGLLIYLFGITAILFLLIEPYNKNKFIRFHSFQCLFTWGAFIAASIALSVVAMIPVLGWIIGLVMALVLPLASLVLWVVLLVTAFQGKMWKVPFIGDLAMKQV